MTNHLVTGAAIAVMIKNPVLALPLAFVSHFVLDALPHYGEIKPDEYTYSRSSWAVVIVNLMLSITFLLWLGLNTHYFLIACAVVAFSPDLVWSYRFVKNRLGGKVGPRNAFSRFHEKLQRESRWGIVVELLYLIVLATTLMKAL